jgi:acid phosphatase (class A)
MYKMLRVLLLVTLASACASEPAKVATPASTTPAVAKSDTPTPAAPTSPMQPERILGYLAREAVPNSRTLSPPPPVADSPAMVLDETVSRAYLEMAGSERFKLASLDAVLDFPQAADTFTCALEAPITQTQTPVLYNLLRRALVDAGRGTSGAKDLYRRARPFMVNNLPTCSPDADAILRTNGSYPSGHSSAGWTWALILAEVDPAHANAILARGRAFAQSRLVCNVHWYSDTVEGVTMGSAVVARMHGEPAFVQDVETARKELAAVRATGAKPTRDCAMEAAALAQQPRL